MKDIYNKEDVDKVALAVVNEVKEKAQELILDSVYNQLSGYLYEHYVNNKNKIENELICSITEEYVKNPKEYKYKDLRAKMFLENKEEIIKVLTDEAIYQSVENVIEQYTHRNYHFEWRWKDGIARFILENFDKFKDDERVNDWIGRRIKMQDDRIKYLEEQLSEINELSN